MANGFTFKLNTSEVIKNITIAKSKVNSAIQKELNAFGKSTVNDAKRMAPVDEGTLRNSIGFVKEDLKVTITVNVDYAAYIEFGTKRFAAAYVSTLPAEWQDFASQFKGAAGKGSVEEFILRIMEWVKRKGIGKTYDIKTRRAVRVGRQTAAQTAEADAYTIAIHILRNGIRPHPFLFPAFEKNKIELIKNIKEALSK
jgi:HK97 gp10 family phage protein